MPAQADAADLRAARDRHLAECLRRVVDGDAAAFEAFYDATFGYAQAVARRYAQGADCEDLLAEVYFEAWRSAPRYDPARGSPVTWLLVLVKSRALDAWRLRQTHPSVQPDNVHRAEETTDELSAEADVDPSEQLWRCQCDQRVGAALAALSGSERWVLGLAYFRELSHGQIAAATGMPLGTVKSLIHRAQAKLRQDLGGSLAPS